MQNNFKDYYAILKIGRNASSDEIKKSYYKQIRLYHPDKNPGKGKAGEEISKAINRAKDELLDPVKRIAYNRLYDEHKNKSEPQKNKSARQKNTNGHKNNKTNRNGYKKNNNNGANQNGSYKNQNNWHDQYRKNNGNYKSYQNQYKDNYEHQYWNHSSSQNNHQDNYENQYQNNNNYSGSRNQYKNNNYNSNSRNQYQNNNDNYGSKNQNNNYNSGSRKQYPTNNDNFSFVSRIYRTLEDNNSWIYVICKYLLFGLLGLSALGLIGILIISIAIAFGKLLDLVVPELFYGTMYIIRVLIIATFKLCVILVDLICTGCCEILSYILYSVKEIFWATVPLLKKASIFIIKSFAKHTFKLCVIIMELICTGFCGILSYILYSVKEIFWATVPLLNKASIFIIKSFAKSTIFIITSLAKLPFTILRYLVA